MRHWHVELCFVILIIYIHVIIISLCISRLWNAHVWSISINMDVNLDGDGPVFGSPCGCDISEKSATAILRFTSDSTHHKPREERAESYTAQASVVWPGTSLLRNRGLARHATKCRVLSFMVLDRLGGIGICRAVATLVSANFQINDKAIPYWKLVWMDSTFLRSPPDEGQSEDHSDWGYNRQSCWVCL